MNESCMKINERERELEKEEQIHQKFVIQFSKNLENSKKGLSEKQIKNAEQFYLIMRRGEHFHKTPPSTFFRIFAFFCIQKYFLGRFNAN